MNQSILFNDDAQWLEAQQLVMFTAQQMGMKIECYVALTKLAQWIAQSGIDNTQEPLAMFEQCRFDVEELAERLINQEAFNQKGQIIIQ
ncbi:DUF1488 domain-containing protein [Shewanella waksmanii]|uniref:DUF1488 domain-containing protein n=1 Tax=Shewanella waksmanii TaxID=213783 RepID=UPI003734DAAA